MTRIVRPYRLKKRPPIPPLKMRIIAALRRAGAGGMSGDDLFAMVYDGQLTRGSWVRQEQARSVLKAHVHQIRKAGRRIVGSSCPGGWYRLV